MIGCMSVQVGVSVRVRVSRVVECLYVVECECVSSEVK